MKFQESSFNGSKVTVGTKSVTHARTHPRSKSNMPHQLFQSWGHKNKILTSIKGRNSVANLRKTKIYNTYVDLVNDNLYTKFGLNLLIHSQDIEQKQNSDVNQRP